MRTCAFLTLLAIFPLSVGALVGDDRLASGLSVSGEYIEARTCDVWTGPCFSNGEINLTGDHAVMAWMVDKGRIGDVTIDGLKIAAVVDAEGTLGTGSEGKVRSIVYIDVKADERQGKALLEMAIKLAPRYLGKILRVERRAITVEHPEHCRVKMSIAAKEGKLAEVTLETSALNAHCDTICGNEEKAYPSLGTTVGVLCAKTKAHAYRGAHLGVKWSDPGARSAMIGRFRL